jgi:hypothetical protein
MEDFQDYYSTVSGASSFALSLANDFSMEGLIPNLGKTYTLESTSAS